MDDMRFSIDRIRMYVEQAEKARAIYGNAQAKLTDAKARLDAAEAAFSEHQKYAHAVKPKDQVQEDARYKNQEKVFSEVEEARAQYADAAQKFRMSREGPRPEITRYTAIRDFLDNNPETPAPIREMFR